MTPYLKVRRLLDKANEEGVKVKRLLGGVELEERKRTKLGEDLSQVLTPLAGGEEQRRGGGG